MNLNAMIKINKNLFTNLFRKNLNGNFRKKNILQIV